MKKNNRFSEPTRQSPVAIILLIWKFYKQIIRQAWYILLPILFGGDRLKENQVFYIILILTAFAVISLVFAILAYFRFYFYVENDEIFIQRGVIKKTSLNIPFDRVQTVNFQQNLVHQVFDVVRLDIDTAGSKGNEFSFDAIDKETANSLRTMLLAARAREKTEDLVQDKVDLIPMQTPILKLSLGQLVKIGLSQNHLRSAGLFFLFILWIYQQLQDAGVELESRIEQIEWQGLNPSFSLILFLVIAYFLLIIIISVARTLLVHFDLEFVRSGKGFKVNSGLLNRRQFSALDKKIQMISWSDNPLKRALGIFDLNLKQASSVEISSKKSLRIPGAMIKDIHEVHHYLYPKIDIEGKESHSIHFSFFWRRLLYAGIIPSILLFSGLYYFEYTEWLWTALILLTYNAITSYVAYRKWRFYFHPEMIRTAKGVFGNFYTEMPVYKVQNVKVNQNLYQQRRSLANIVLYSASGSMRIPYIPIELAYRIRDYILYKVEIDKRSWM